MPHPDKLIFDPIFIDWMTIRIKCVHKTLNNGFIQSVDVNNDIEWTTERRFMAEGSFSTRLQIRSEIDVEFYNAMDAYSGYLVISGNLGKYLFGHNVYGSGDGIGLVREVFKRLVNLNIVKLPCFAFYPKVLSLISDGDFEVFRLDLTEMLECGSLKNALDAIEVYADTSRTRYGKATRKKGTVYWQAGSNHWSAKMYHKHTEITKKSKNHRLSQFLPPLAREILRGVCISQLRFEVQLNSRKLKDMYLKTHPDYGFFASQTSDNLTLPPLKYWQFLQLGGVESVYMEFRERVELMENIQLNEEKALSLSTPAYSTYSQWKSGKDPLTRLPKSTYQRHKAEIKKKLGIDIIQPYSRVEKHSLTCVRVLDLRASNVVDIFSRLEALPVESEPLRIIGAGDALERSTEAYKAKMA